MALMFEQYIFPSIKDLSQESFHFHAGLSNTIFDKDFIRGHVFFPPILSNLFSISVS
jgi:hypothetical protein